MTAERHTIVIAGGLERKAGRQSSERALVLSRMRAHDFRGAVVVHDAESADLRPLDVPGRPRACQRLTPRRRPGRVRHRRGDLGTRWRVLTARRVRGRRHLLPGTGAVVARTVALTHRGSRGKVAAALARHTAVTGVSIVLDHPRLIGRYNGYPSSADAVAAVARFPLPRAREQPAGIGALPDSSHLTRELTAVARPAGPPAVVALGSTVARDLAPRHPTGRASRHDRRTVAMEICPTSPASS